MNEKIALTAGDEYEQVALRAVISGEEYEQVALRAGISDLNRVIEVYKHQVHKTVEYFYMGNMAIIWPN